MAFLDAARRQTTRKLLGWRLTLTAQGSYPAYTMLLCEDDVGTYNGLIVQQSTIGRGIEFGVPMQDVGRVEIELADRGLSDQPYGSIFGDLVVAYEFVGMALDALAIAVETDGTVYSRCVWTGTVATAPKKLEDGSWRIEALEMNVLEKLVPDVITLGEYPNASDTAVGGAKQIVYGDCWTRPAVPTATNATNRDLEAMGLAGLDRVVPLACISKDAAVAYPYVELMLAGHLCQRMSTSTEDTVGVFYQDSGQRTLFQISPLEINGRTNTAAGATIQLSPWSKINFNQLPQWANAANNANNPTNAMDGDVATFAELNVTNGWTMLRLDLSRPPDYGWMDTIEVWAYVDYTLPNGSTLNVDLFDNKLGIVIGLITTTRTGTATGQLVKVVSLSGIGTPSDIATGDMSLRVYLSPAVAGDYARIYCARVMYAVWPRYDLVRNYKAAHIPIEDVPEKMRSPGVGNDYAWLPDISQFLNLDARETTLFGAACGRKDDAGGSLTGVPNMLLEEPAVIVADALANYVGVPLGSLVLFTSAHARFDQARGDQAAAFFAMAFSVPQKIKARTLIENVNSQAVQTLVMVHSDSWSLPKWGLVWWGSPQARNYYGRAIDYQYVESCEIDKTPLRDVRNMVSCNYAYSHPERKTLRMCYVNGTTSDDGYGSRLNEPSLTTFADSEAMFGRVEQQVALNYIHSQPSACKSRNLQAVYRVWPRVRVELVIAGWEYIDLQVGMNVDLDNDSFRAAKKYYPGKTGAGPEPTGRGYWSYAGVTRYFIVEEVTIGPGWQKLLLVEGVWSWT